MYNEEQKERFIAEFTSNLGRRKVAYLTFEALEKYENAWGADFCTRKEAELKPVIDEITGIREDSKKTRLSVLKAYVKWCQENGVPDTRDDLLKMKDFGGEKIKRQMVSNPSHLQRFLDTAFDKEANQTVDNIYRAYFWLAYSGVNEEDVLNIKISDVDLSQMIVKFGGKEYQLYREAIPSIRNCVELSSFRYIHPNYADKEIRKPRVNSDTLLRATILKSVLDMRTEASKKQRLQKFRSEDEKKDKSLDLRLSFDRVNLSGMFYRMYEAERAGVPVSFVSAASDFVSGKQYKSDEHAKATIRNVANKYKVDYENWKEAFAR